MFCIIYYIYFTNFDIDCIERVQNRFLKYMSFKLNIPIIDHNYNLIRSTLNVQTLLLRRERYNFC